MAEETKNPVPETPAAASAEVVVPVAEKASTTLATLVEKEAVVPQPEPEPVPVPETPDKPAAEDAPVEATSQEGKTVTESASFKEESNVAEELPDPEKKALDELKKLVLEALNKREFTPPPPKEEEKKAEPEPTAAVEESKTEEPPKAEAETLTPPAPEPEAVVEEKKEETPAPPAPEPKAVVEEKKVETPAPPAPETKEVVEEKKETPPPPPVAEPAVVLEKVKAKTEAAEDDSSKTVEEIKETIVEVAASTAAPPPAPAEETKEEPKEVEAPVPPEEVSIWGIPLMADEKTDVVLLKFLRARDLKVKEAFSMLKSVVAWRKQFGIEEEEVAGEESPAGLEKVVYMHGVDKEGHPVCYNSLGEFQDKELYQNTFSDKEKLSKFLKWRIQFMEKSIRTLDFTPDGICTFVQVIDLKNTPGLFFFKKELRLATNRALQLLQDNYPEFVAKQVFINVPWWYPAYYRMINGIFTPRTQSKFVFAGPSRSAETLFKYIAPEQIPVQYGGLNKEGEQEFTTSDPATEETIKPASKQTIEFPVTEKCNLVWETRVVGWDVSYGAEFVPSAEGGYTVIVQKSRKIGPSDESVIAGSFKCGEAGKVVLTFDNQTSKKKKLLYRSKTKPSE